MPRLYKITMTFKYHRKNQEPFVFLLYKDFTGLLFRQIISAFFHKLSEYRAKGMDLEVYQTALNHLISSNGNNNMLSDSRTIQCYKFTNPRFDLWIEQIDFIVAP